MSPGTVTAINRAADRIAVQLSNGRIAVCRLFDRRESPAVGAAVHGRLSKPGASLLTVNSTRRTLRALVLAVYPNQEAAIEMVHA